MKWRSIRHIIPSKKLDMSGILLDQPLPASGLDHEDPYLLIHHWKHTFYGGQRENEVGVGPHPHRGFSPVTLVFKGAVHHRDSLGNDSVVEKGGVQWINSGQGIVHSERPTKHIAEFGGEFEIVQFWVNTPAKRKLDPPSYTALSESDIPHVLSTDGEVTSSVVAGSFNGVYGKVDTLSDLLVVSLSFNDGGQEHISIPENFNAVLYLLDGDLMVNGITEAGGKELICFAKEEGGIHLKAHAHTRALLLAGEPLNEQIAMEGPFVMNEHAEVLQAMRDYQTGKMGELVEIFE